MTQRLNIVLECNDETAIKESLSDIGFYFKNAIYASADFPITESAFAKYNSAIAAVNNAILSTDYQGAVYLQFLNTECVWNT